MLTILARATNSSSTVFDMKASQEEVFDGVAVEAVSAMAGFNSTIFAYGKPVAGKPLLLLVGPNATSIVVLFHEPCRIYSASRSKLRTKDHVVHKLHGNTNETAYDLLARRRKLSS